MTELLWIASIIVFGFLVGLLLGRWWALALAFMWLPFVAVFHDPSPDSTLLAGVLLTLLLAVPIQAVGLALGVLVRRRIERPG